VSCFCKLTVLEILPLGHAVLFKIWYLSNVKVHGFLRNYTALFEIGVTLCCEILFNVVRVNCCYDHVYHRFLDKLYFVYFLNKCTNHTRITRFYDT